VEAGDGVLERELIRVGGKVLDAAAAAREGAVTCATRLPSEPWNPAAWRR